MEEGDFYSASTPSHIKNELIDLVSWATDKSKATPNATSKELVDGYLEHRDIAYYGDLRILEKVSTRNMKTELWFAVLALVGTMLVFGGIVYYMKHINHKNDTQTTEIQK